MRSDNGRGLSISINQIEIFLLLSLVLMHTFKISGTYIPQIVVGLVAIRAMTKVPVNVQAKYFLFFSIYLLGMSMFFTIINGTSILDTIRYCMRLFYPFLAIIVGGFFRKKITTKSFLYILIFFLLFEFAISYLQINNLGFREWTYNLYRSDSTIDRYLNSFSYASGGRAIGTLNNPNTLGLTFIVLSSSIIMMSDALKNKKTINIMCSLVTIYVIINSQSRTSILMYVFIIAMILYWKFSKAKRNNAIFFIVSIAFAVLLLLFIQSRIGREISASALDTRLEVWDIRILQMFDYVQYGSFLAIMLGGGFQMARYFGFFDNTYLKIFVSGGIIGLLLFFLVVFCVYKGIRKIRRTEYRHLGWILFITWLIGSMLVEYQEVFKLSTITFIMLGYVLYSDTISDDGELIIKDINNN